MGATFHEVATCYKFDVRRSSRVAVEYAPAYELVLSIAVAASDAATPEALALRAAAGDDLIARVRRFAESDWMWVHLVSVAAESPAPRDAEALGAYLERQSARELQRRLVGYYVEWFRAQTAPEVIDAAIRGEPAAAATFVEHGKGEDALWTRSLRARLEAGPGRTKAELIAIVEEWTERVFEPVTAPTLRRLRAAAAVRRRALAGTGEPAGTGARRVMVPSLVIRPVIHEFEHGTTKFICVPADAATDTPASEEVLRTSRALSDESRLRVLMALAAQDMGAQELADRLGLAVSTVLHHLAALRAAGLVAGGGRRRAYRIDREGLARAAETIGGIAPGGQVT